MSKYTGQPIAQVKVDGPSTDFKVAEKATKPDPKPESTIGRSGSSMDMKEARRTLKKWQAPFRKK